MGRELGPGLGLVWEKGELGLAREEKEPGPGSKLVDVLGGQGVGLEWEWEMEGLGQEQGNRLVDGREAGLEGEAVAQGMGWVGKELGNRSEEAGGLGPGLGLGVVLGLEREELELELESKHVEVLGQSQALGLELEKGVQVRELENK